MLTDLERRFLVVQAVEAARTMADDVVVDPREADVGSVLGFGFAPFTGGALSYIDGMGVERLRRAVRRPDCEIRPALRAAAIAARNGGERRNLLWAFRREGASGVIEQASSPPPFAEIGGADCAIIGAGPAGLMAADTLSRAGARVTVYDHKPSAARKLLMAGRGGLNITHSEPLDVFLIRYGAARERLTPVIRAFSPEALRDFCATLGEESFVGSSGRVFPKSFKAAPLLRAWLARLSAQGVRFAMRRRFEKFGVARELILRDAKGEAFAISPDAVVFALGGGSWPRLGSDGGWAESFVAAGVDVAPLAPANRGALIAWSDFFRDSFEGQPIKTVALRHGETTARGDVVVTRAGLEGGPAYALASRLREDVVRNGTATLRLDLRPDADAGLLAQKLQRRDAKQSLATALRKTLNLSKLDVALLHEARPQGLPREDLELAALVKGVPLRVDGVADFARAISTSGGVKFEALDDALMLKSRPGVFIAGEMLDFDAPTGGYLLQAAFSTGFVAGQGAARFLGLQAQAYFPPEVIGKRSAPSPCSRPGFSRDRTARRARSPWPNRRRAAARASAPGRRRRSRRAGL